MVNNYSFVTLGYMPDPDIDMERSHNLVLKKIKKYNQSVKKKLLKVGIEFKGYKIYIPSSYNYAVDTLDIILDIKDTKKLAEYMARESEKLNFFYKQNKSYDGYIALTPSTITEAIKQLKDKTETDCILIQFVLAEEYNAIKEIVKDSKCLL
jgi:hypothetical protein